MSIDEARLRELVSDPYQHVYSREWREMAKQLLEARAEIEWLKSDLYHAIQALHCSAPNELMSVEEIRAWLEIRNTLSDKYKEAT